LAFSNWSHLAHHPSIDKGDVFATLNEHIQNGTVLQLLEQASPKTLHSIIELATDHHLLNLLLQVTLWASERRELFAAFLFPESQISDGAAVFDFLIALKQTLISATRLCGDIDAGLLLPASVVRRGNRRTLNDFALVLEHQIAIGISKLSLFDPSVNKTSIIARLFVENDIDRGFALSRIFKVDIDEVMIEACAHITQYNDVELCRFLLGVIPKLQLESANRLIEALASILIRCKGNGAFIGRLVSGVGDLRNVFQILR
jgi:hypothetical protein